MIGKRAHDHGGAGHLVRIVAFLTHGLLRIALLSAFSASRVLGSVGPGLSDNKKGPEEAPTHTACIRDGLAIPGGVPGYHDNKEFGNNITHASAQLPKGCAIYTGPTLNVKARQHAQRRLRD
jgi:hypothetical protein